jgi:hypothetical protein
VAAVSGDYAAMAGLSARRRHGSLADDSACAHEALASDLPTVIQAPMENVPSTGHWDINDVYRRGE